MENQTPAAGIVLVVEDEPLIRIWLADVLEAAGYDVITANTGDEGLEFLKRERQLAALVTDVNLPGSLNGLSLAWKARGCHPEARVLVVSGQVRPRPEDLPPGARFLGKPVQTATLLRTLGE